MTEAITHRIRFVSQFVAPLFTDKEQTPVVVRREQRKAQPPVKGKQALVLIACNEHANEALEEDKGNGQHTEKECRLVLASFFQQEIEYGKQRSQAGKIEQCRDTYRYSHLDEFLALISL